MSEERAKGTRAQKQKKEEKKIYTYYEIKDGRLSRRLRKCPRCGSFMAGHKTPERWACGNCGYTEFATPMNAPRPR
ncbi:30S ribosomal protein S27ae [Candidatus Bathyarchaeota archaeon]|jgi:small subunit ribosomal protein S27Ae|nr:30S ribosomal protein S27ae [Candidatus Bathyarchaeota archaeon]